MNASERTEALVLKYWRSWQEPADFRALRTCLADDVVFDTGTQTLSGAEQFTEAVETTESPWKAVTMLASIFDAEQAAIFYEGTDKLTGVKTRVAEHLTVRGDHIAKITALICPLVPGAEH